MSKKEWAKQEIDIAIKRERGSGNHDGWDYGCVCYESAYKAFCSLLEDGHSGMSITFTKNILNRLIEGKPLAPIEDTPDIWNMAWHRDDGSISYQCKRMSSLFKEVFPDGTMYYRDVDRFICIDTDSPTVGYRSSFVNGIVSELYPITMPYMPTNKPMTVSTSDFLYEEGNGDFDTTAIWYVLEPDGTKRDINRFFKESEDGFVEIDRAEYDEREKRKVVRCDVCGEEM